MNDGDRYVRTTEECQRIVSAIDALFDPQAPSIEEEIDAIWSDVPESEWGKVPTDLSERRTPP